MRGRGQDERTDFAHGAGPADDTRAVEEADPVDARPVVLTRLRSALVDF